MNKSSILASILLAAVAIDGATVAHPPASARRLRTRNVYPSSGNRGLASLVESSFGEERNLMRALEGMSMSSMSMSMVDSLVTPPATMATEDTATSEDGSAAGGSGDDAPSATEVAPRSEPSSGAASMGMMAASSAIVTAAAAAAAAMLL